MRVDDRRITGDEADRIDVGKLRRMTEWMYVTGWTIANGQRPGVDSGFKLERTWSDPKRWFGVHLARV